MVALLLSAGVILTHLVWTADPCCGPVDLNGAVAALEPSDVPPREVVARQDAVDAGSGRIVVPSVHLDVPLGALNEVDGVITPPGFASMYWVRNRGVAVEEAAHGTVYIVTHSLRGGGMAPGNYLFETDTGQPTLEAGDTMVVDGVEYAVESLRIVPKTQLEGDRDLWSAIPDRLVLITCLQAATDTPSVENLVIVAQRVSTPYERTDVDASAIAPGRAVGPVNGRSHD
ncbi:hypothetical protein ASD13_16955 [Microbacterium sp. Root1433D1]|nr:hypothetical protein ASD13_16955 [Microbacterium sp. Root1433D1]